MSAANDGGPPHEDRVPRGVGAMSVVRWALVLVMGLVAALSIAYATGALAKVSSGAPEHAGLYYCPMHPSVVQDHPGECPICSMTLVPKPEGGSDQKMKPSSTMAAGVAPRAVPGLAGVDLPADRIQLIGMRTAKVERAALSNS